jgi:ElaB/YqjD/DUF883 family membrane-anchored ribosome-binding protein
MQDQTSPGVATNGEQLRQGFSSAKDHLKAAGASASEALRGRAQSASEAARARATEARDWAQTRFSGIQGRVESQPQTAALWALGIGVAAGILLGAMLRGSGRD